MTGLSKRSRTSSVRSSSLRPSARSSKPSGARVMRAAGPGASVTVAVEVAPVSAARAAIAICPRSPNRGETWSRARMAPGPASSGRESLPASALRPTPVEVGLPAAS